MTDSTAAERFAYALGGVLVVALVLRVALVLATPHFVPQTDASDYDRTAVSLVQHGQFPPTLLAPAGGPTAFRPPLFPVALGAVYKVLGSSSASSRWEAGRLLEAALGTITVALICLIALRLWGRGVAIVSGIIAAVYPPLLLVGSSLMSESLFIPLALGAVLSALASRGSPHMWRWSLLAGLLLGLAALTRSNGIVLVGPLVFLVWDRRPWLSWSALRAPLALVAVMIAVLTPWTVRNAHVFGSFVPITTESGYALAGTYNRYAEAETRFPALWGPPVLNIATAVAHHPGLNEAQISTRLDSQAFSYIGAHPGYLLKVFYWNALRLLNVTGPGYERWAAQWEAYPPALTEISVYAFWALGLLALAGAVTRSARRAPRSFWFCPAVILLSTVFVQGATRYRSPADPFFVMLAALAVVAVWQRVRTPRLVPSPAA